MQKRSVITRWLVMLTAGFAVVGFLAACGGDNNTGGGSGSSQSSGGSATDINQEADKALEISQIKIGELNFDMAKYCGDKPFTAGKIDGFGGNTWRVETRALIEKLAKSCPNNEGVEYFDANLDPQKFNSTINSWAAQGVDVIVAFDDFGQSAVPAFRAATQKGVKVVTDNAIPGNAKVPDDLTAAVVPDFDKGGLAWAEFLEAATGGKGRIVYVGGPAGNLFDPPAIEGLKNGLAQIGAKSTLVDQEPQFANWDPAKTQQVMSALLQKYKDINGVVLSYVATAPAIVRAFEAANLPLPAITGQSSSNEWVCQVTKLRESNPEFQAHSLDGSGNQAALAFAKGLAAFQGIDAPELGPTDAYTVSNYATYIDTVNNVLPECDPDLPPGADLSHALTKEEILAAIG